MKSLKSHVIYDSRKRRGILFFATIVFGSLLVSVYYKPTSKLDVSKQELIEVAEVQKAIDSLKNEALLANKPKIFPFNPNFITDYKGYTMGMSVDEIDRLLRFRESGKWINSTADFKRVTGVSDSLLAKISPFFKFPAWVTKSNKVKSSRRTWKTAAEKHDLNAITFDELLKIEGMNSAAATKIYQHLQNIGGYQVDQQIYDVYGVSSKLKRLVLNLYTVKTPPEIELLDVNTANASDLATIPLLSFDLAKEIIDYRLLRGGIKSLEELKDMDGMTAYKYDRIKLYLHID